MRRRTELVNYHWFPKLGSLKTQECPSSRSAATRLLRVVFFVRWSRAAPHLRFATEKYGKSTHVRHWISTFYAWVKDAMKTPATRLLQTCTCNSPPVFHLLCSAQYRTVEDSQYLWCRFQIGRYRLMSYQSRKSRTICEGYSCILRAIVLVALYTVGFIVLGTVASSQDP